MENSQSPLWSVKYGPKTLDDFYGNEKVKAQLKKYVEQQNMPNLLFTGQESTGKQTLINLFVKEFLKEEYNLNYSLLFAEDPLTDTDKDLVKSQSYISTSRIGSAGGSRFNYPPFIQSKVKPFAEIKRYGNAPFKILCVNKFDELQKEQPGFRRLMEMYSSNVRFILVTTQVSAIIEPIVSRCQLIFVSALDFETFVEAITEVQNVEGFTLDARAMDSLYNYCHGGLGKALDVLQICSLKSRNISEMDVFKTTDQVSISVCNTLTQEILFKGINAAEKTLLEIFKVYKFTAKEIMNEMVKSIKKMPLERLVKAKLIDIIAESDMDATQGRNDHIQMMALLSKLEYVKGALK